MKKTFVILSAALIIFSSCSKDEEEVIQPTTTTINTTTPAAPRLIFKIHFDANLDRLDNFGNPSTIPVGNAAQSPNFHSMSAHYIELSQDSTTQLGNGYIPYMAAETTAGGSNAVDFDQAVIVGDNETIYSVPLSQVTAGTYKWLRVSLSYQNYDIDFLSNGLNLTGRLASFVGFNNYITNHTINTQSVTVNSNKLQGYWAFETTVLGMSYVSEGESAATTVPNPLEGISDIPAGSCVVTGDFDTPITLTGNETSDVTVYINLSTNNSFEWKDLNGDGLFEPTDGVNPGDTVVDMGLRGLFPTWQ